MQRTWSDELGRTWDVELDVPDVPPDLEVDVGDATLIFGSEDEMEREIEVLGPIEETFDSLSDQALQHALDAAGTQRGILLLDEEETLWWVRGPEPGVEEGEWAVRFSDGERTLTHDGPVREEAERLGEDELLELLDEERGRLLEPLDLRV